jgi:hypothetical protein
MFSFLHWPAMTVSDGKPSKILPEFEDILAWGSTVSANDILDKDATLLID